MAADTVEYDYVIVGAGSAGCVLANRLSEDGHRVLLLEAGPSDARRAIHVPAAATSLLGSEVDWGYLTEPQARLDGRLLGVPRGRTLGGSSSINAQVYLRGHRADFDEWAALGNPGWDFESVRPYFERADGLVPNGGARRQYVRDRLRVTPLLDPHPLTDSFIAAAVQAGIARNDDLNTDLEGVGRVFVTQSSGRRWSTADAYLRPALARPNLSVATDALATRLLFEGRRAVGVEFLERGVRRRARTREVILSGGVINSPQLLLLSGIGPANQLAAHGIEVVHSLPGVGRNLQDHLDVPVTFAVDGLPQDVVESATSTLRYALARRGRLASNQAEAAAFVRTRPDLDAPDLELQFVAPRLRPLYLNHRWAVARARDVAQRVSGRESRVKPRVLTIGAIVIRPGSTGWVELRSADPLDPPRIDPDYLADPDDLRVLVAGIRLIRRIADSPALSGLLVDEFLPGRAVQSDDEIESFIRARAGSFQHLSGTCKMGTDDLAVVDPELRVHGVKGVRVVDASVFPCVPRGHLNAPAVMVAERASDLILSAAGRRRALVVDGGGAAAELPASIGPDTLAAGLRGSAARISPLWLDASGSSMEPVIRPGQQLAIVPADRPRWGEVWAYCDDGGRVIAHRCIRRSGTSYRFQGETTLRGDPWVAPDRLIGRVVAIGERDRVRRVGARDRWTRGLMRKVQLESRRAVGALRRLL